MGFLSIGIGFLGNIFGNLLGSLFGIGGGADFGAAINSLGDQVSSLADNLASLSKIITDALKGIEGAFGAIWSLLQSLWENYIKPFLDWLWKELKKLYDWLQKHLKSLLDHLKAWKKWYDTYILPQQLRLLAMIQDIRRILGILSLFGVKWAAKLDATLADIQNRIVQSVLLVETTLNAIINTIAIAFDPSLLLRSNVLGGSLLGNLAAVKRIMGYGGQRALTGSEAAFQLYGSTRYQSGGVTQHVNALAAGGLTANDQTENGQARAALTQITGAPLPLPGPTGGNLLPPGQIFAGL